MAKQKKDDSKLDPVQRVLAGILAKAGKGSAQILGAGADSDVEEVIPSGIDVLDHHVLGIGGWPLGRIVELYADEGVGKSSLMFQTMAGVHRENGIVALAETEHAIESSRASVFGCNIDQAILSQPDCMEEALAMLEHTLDAFPNSVKGDPPMFIGWDSLAATPTRKEVTEGIDGKAAVADRARLMSEALRILTPKVARKRALMMIVNQTRTKIGMVFGSNRTTPGGDALKFHASVRLELFSGKSVKDAHEDHIGKQVTMMAAKTKIGGKPWAKAKVRLYYDSGWNNTWSTVWHAKDRKVVPKDAKYTEESYLLALEKLGWKRGFAAGGAVVGTVDDDEVKDTDDELLGEDL